eukprot:2569444-Prorocentrum_lima.AAC.1
MCQPSPQRGCRSRPRLSVHPRFSPTAASVAGQIVAGVDVKDVPELSVPESEPGSSSPRRGVQAP